MNEGKLHHSDTAGYEPYFCLQSHNTIAMTCTLLADAFYIILFLETVEKNSQLQTINDTQGGRDIFV